VDTKSRLEVSRFMEVVLEAFTKRMTVRANEVRLHFRLADHSIPDNHQQPNVRKRYSDVKIWDILQLGTL